jgi:5-methylcytosine-specific restriction endonuclease McrA
MFPPVSLFWLVILASATYLLFRPLHLASSFKAIASKQRRIHLKTKQPANLGRTALAIDMYSCCICHTLRLTIDHLNTKEQLPTKREAADNQLWADIYTLHYSCCGK